MKTFKLLPRLFAVFGLAVMFAVSGFGVDECSNTTSHIFTESGTDATYHDSYSGNRFDSGDNEYYYFRVPVAGTLTFTRVADTDVTYKYHLSNCPGDSTGTALNDTNSIHLTSDTDFNMRIHSAADNQHYDFTFVFVADQVPPVMNTVPNQTATVGIAYTLNIASYVTLTNGDSILSYTLTGTLPPGLTFDSATGIISGTPTTVNTTGVTLNVTATDNDGTSNVKSFTIAVPAQTPPIINVPNQTAMQNIYYTLSLASFTTMTDGDPILSYALTGTLPPGLTFDSATGIISGTPTTVNTTGVTLNVTATDNDGTSASDSFTLKVNALSYSTANLRAFTKQRQDNIYGDMQIIGNSVKLQTGGVCAPNGTVNNDIVAVYAELDGNTTDGTFNSTSADLRLPAGVDRNKILYANLYWQGRTNSDNLTPNGKTMKLKAYKASTYTTINTIESKFNWNGNGDYQGVADVTDLIKASVDAVPLATRNASDFNITLWAADVYAPASSDGKNDFGAWSIVVVYKNPDLNAKFRSITLYDGYESVWNNTKTATLGGFLTPKTGLVDAKFLVFAGEGDIAYDDNASLTKPDGTEVVLPNAPGTPAGTYSVFGSSEDVAGVNVTARNKACQNTIGIDIRTFNVGNVNGGQSIIGNNQTSTIIRLGSDGDEYFPGVFAFSTELYMPKLCYDYSLKQDGRFFSINRTNPLARIDQSISSSPVELVVYLRNKEADIAAEGISLKSEVNASRFSYTMTNPMYVSNPNGSVLLPRGVPALNSPANCTYSIASGNAINDQGCVVTFDNSTVATNDDILRVRKGDGTLGSEEYIFTKFILQPQQISGILDDVNESLGLTLDYYISAGGVTVDYTDYPLGGPNVGICTPSATYQPSWGLFNVVEHGQTPPVLNNIKAKISRKAFDVDVAYDATPITGTNDVPGTAGTPLGPINTTVLVEMIDVDSFGDINASCANPDAGVSAPIVVNNMNITSSNNMTMVPSQLDSYYNFALKNGAFRVWYFTESNGTLIQNWGASGLSSTSLYVPGTTTATGLFKVASHGDCNSSCGVTGGSISSPACFTCMKDYYGKPLCSRDNFSVRPEAFDIRIKDFDAVGVSTDLSHNVYGFAPDTTPTSSRMNLAAGYQYKYDVNATGHEDSMSGLVAVPRYTRYFNGANPDYNITMVWDSALTLTQCNDIAPRSLQFFIADGARVDQLEPLDQVGEYRLNMIDKSWTAVDQVTTNSNRTALRGFDITTDCDLSTSSTVMIGGEFGCQITSDHSNGALQYKDQPVVFKPAKFDLTGINYGLGMTSAPIVAGGQGFVYMSDLNNTNDMNMSVRSSGQIKALGDNNSTLSNFVGGCFARDITMKVDTNASFVGDPSFNARMITSDIADTNRTDSGEIDLNSSLVGTITAVNFHKIDNGSTLNTLRLNFDRNQTVAFEPQTVMYGDINVSCLNLVDCNHSSIRNSTPNTAVGTDAMDFNVTHVYGRVIARGERVIVNQPFDIQANYEVYRTPVLLGTPLVQDTFDADWRVNALHNTTMIYGDAVVTVIDPNPNASAWTPYSTSYYDNNGTEVYNFGGISTRQGYKGHIDTEGWLWNGATAKTYQDPNGPAQTGTDNLDCLTHPCFDISFGRIVGNTGSAKTESEAQKANKNSSSTGWSTTYEYAPATR